jgi:hypothetical protein
MPQIPNPQTVANSLDLQQAVQYAMLSYAAQILKDESPIVAPNQGYQMYAKRMSLANQVVQTFSADSIAPWAKRGATIVAMIQPDVVLNEQATFRYMLQDNPTGRNCMESGFDLFQWNVQSNTSGRQMWDTLAGVTQLDLQ